MARHGPVWSSSYASAIAATNATSKKLLGGRCSSTVAT